MSEPRRKLSISVPALPWRESPNRMNDDLPQAQTTEGQDKGHPENSRETAADEPS
jgi:hypothetical protein